MRNPEDKKTVRKTVLMTESLAKDIDEEAKQRGIKPNAVMNERMEHPNRDDNKPSNLVVFQDFANKVVKKMKQFSEEDAKQFEREANNLWKF